MILQCELFLIVLVPDQTTYCDKYDNGRRCDGRTIRSRLYEGVSKSPRTMLI